MASSGPAEVGQSGDAAGGSVLPRREGALSGEDQKRPERREPRQSHMAVAFLPTGQGDGPRPRVWLALPRPLQPLPGFDRDH